MVLRNRAQPAAEDDVDAWRGQMCGVIPCDRHTRVHADASEAHWQRECETSRLLHSAGRRFAHAFQLELRVCGLRGRYRKS